MTNKEQLATIEPLAWVQRVDWLYHAYGKRYTDTWVAIADWLEQEYVPVKPLHTNAPGTWYYCPICYMSVVKGDPKCYKCCTDLVWEDDTL